MKITVHNCYKTSVPVEKSWKKLKRQEIDDITWESGGLSLGKEFEDPASY